MIIFYKVLVPFFNNYSTSARWIRVCYNHLMSNKREWNNCFITNAHKISRILLALICKNNRFSACFSFWADAYSCHIWRAWYNGSYTKMAKPIRALEFHYPMIQVLIIGVSAERLPGQGPDLKSWRPWTLQLINNNWTTRSYRIYFVMCPM